MRKFLILFLIIPFALMAQTVPAKRDNLIIIKGSALSQSDIVALLYKNDFEVDIKEKGFLITRYKPVDGINELKMKISLLDTAITIKSFYKLSRKIFGTKMENTVADWRGERGGTPKTVMRAAIKFANQLGGQVSFTKEKP